MLDESIDPLDFIYFDICINCIKEKLTDKRRLEVKRPLDVLGSYIQIIVSHFLWLFKMINNIL